MYKKLDMCGLSSGSISGFAAVVTSDVTCAKISIENAFSRGIDGSREKRIPLSLSTSSSFFTDVTQYYRVAKPLEPFELALCNSRRFPLTGSGTILHSPE